MTRRSCQSRHLLRRSLAAMAMSCAAAAVACAQIGPPPLVENVPLAPDVVPAEIRGLEIANKLGEAIPLSLTFTNVDGSTVKLGEFFHQKSPDGRLDKPVVLMLVYYKCPILCPMVLEKFTNTLNQLDFTAGTEFDAVVVSFDPRDKPADAIAQRANQLLAYKQPTTDSIRDGWTFLTCDSLPGNARALADALGYPFRYQPRNQEYAHGAAVFILTPEGKLSRTLLGLDYPARDVRLGLLEASKGRIGTLVDRFTLWCYHFDPKTGSYTLVAMRIMQVGAAAGAVILGVFIASLFAWERRRRRRASVAVSSVIKPSPLGPSAVGGA